MMLDQNESTNQNMFTSRNNGPSTNVTATQKSQSSLERAKLDTIGKLLNNEDGKRTQWQNKGFYNGPKGKFDKTNDGLTSRGKRNDAKQTVVSSDEEEPQNVVQKRQKSTSIAAKT